MGNKKHLPESISKEMYAQCEESIKYRFKKSALLEQALIHASLREQNGICNERLEFLGDAVVGLIVSEFLYRNFETLDEGGLSLLKSELVSRASLAQMAQKLNLQHCFVCSKGICQKQEEIPVSILANIMEAILGAMYMDGGLEQAYLLVSKYCTEEANQFIRNPYKKNYKSLLQFLTQKYLKITPTYEASSTAGPNNTKIFTSCAVIKGKKFLYGQAKNKKEAEQMAAYLAVQTLASENSEIRDYVYNVLSLEKEFSYKPNLPPSQRKGIKKIFQIFDWLTQ